MLKGSGRIRKAIATGRGSMSPLALPAAMLVVLAFPAMAAAVWTTPVTLSGAGQFADLPQVAVDPGGNAVFVWQRFDATAGCSASAGCLRIQARARSASGTLSAVQTLSAAGEHAEVPEVSVDQTGNSVIVWERFDGAGCEDSRGCLRIQA